jgi:hypothetical protein
VLASCTLTWSVTSLRASVVIISSTNLNICAVYLILLLLLLQNAAAAAVGAQAGANNGDNEHGPVLPVIVNQHAADQGAQAHDAVEDAPPDVPVQQNEAGANLAEVLLLSTLAAVAISTFLF